MTTNVICRPKKLLTSDSRWSAPIIGHPDLFVFADDTGFDKLAVSSAHALVFAGDSELISYWKTWFTAPALDFSKLPPFQRQDVRSGTVESIVASLVKKPSCEVMFTSGRFEAHGEIARFSGSGALYAKDCYARNGCGRTAIKTASQSDLATGGETKFVELASGSSNLTVMQASHSEMITALHHRGLVMDTKTKNVTPISEWMANNGHAQANVASAIGSVSAPTGLPTREWSNQEQIEFIKALQEVAREENRMM